VTKSITQIHDRIVNALPLSEEPDEPRPVYTLDEDDDA